MAEAVAPAGLNLDSIDSAGDTSQLTTNAATFTNLAAGGNAAFTAAVSATANGTLNASYTFNVSDQNLPGATSRGPLTLVLKSIVATPGDADLNGIIDFDDYAHIDEGFNAGLTGWANGDFNGDGVIDFDDYALIDLNFNTQGGAGQLARAMAFLSGDDRSTKGMNTPALRMVELHFAEFGDAYAHAFLNSVPEPVCALAIGGLATSLGTLRRRRRTR